MVRLCLTYWRTTIVIIVLALCAMPGTSRFMLWGLVPALLCVLGALLVAVAVLIGLSIRSRRRSSRPITANPGHEEAS